MIGIFEIRKKEAWEPEDSSKVWISMEGWWKQSFVLESGPS